MKSDKDIHEDLRELSKEMNNISDDIKDIEQKKSPNLTFLYLLSSLFLIMLLIMFIVPSYSIKYDPEPKNIPSLNDVVGDMGARVVNNTFHAVSSYDFLNLLDPSNPIVKQAAVKISTESCENSKLCRAKALFYFVRDEIEYVDDPVFPADDYIETAEEVLYTGGSDCDGTAVLLANLEGAIGIPTKFIFVPGHVYIWIYLEDAPKKYFVDKKDNYGWIALDAACKSCDFGVISSKYNDVEKVYV